MSLTIGVDIGGTKVAAGVVSPAGEILRRERRPTPSTDPAAVAAVVAEVVASLRDGADVVGVGVGAAGFVDASRSTVLFAPNLAWRDEPLRDDIASRVGLPVVVENDANAMAWAEYRFGAGRGVSSLVAVTVGTGIGAGLVLDGRLYRGGFGIAGEPGHMRVVPDGFPCGCGNFGCWEQYCSGRALVREAAALGGPWIEGPAVSLAAQAGDPVATRVFGTVGSWLGQGLADLAAVLDPVRFVVGGGVGEAGELLLGPARQRYAEVLTGRGYRRVAEIVGASLGNEAGLIGAADLARLT